MQTKLKLFLVIVPIALGAGFGLWQRMVSEKILQQPVVSEQSSDVPAFDENGNSIQPPIDPKLSDVINVKDFWMQPNVQKKLIENNFVVNATYGGDEFFPSYEVNRYAQTPNFVTTDAMLHTYHLMFDHLLRRVEETKLIGNLASLNTAMVKQTTAYQKQAVGTPWENAANRSAGLFEVGSKLLDPKYVLPVTAPKEVSAELDLIGKHDAIHESPLINLGLGQKTVVSTPAGDLSLEAYKEDYSQYIPRGHYTKSERLKEYFLSMMWYGRMTLRFKNQDEVKSALLTTLALRDSGALDTWQSIYEPTNFLVGKSDDIGFLQLKPVVDQIYGSKVTAAQVMADTAKFSQFFDAVQKMEAPKLNSIVIFNSGIQPDRETEIKGFRFMGQRYTPDAEIFQHLIDREVKGRMLPKGLDVAAGFGSDRALTHLTDAGDTKFPKYSENMTSIRHYISGLTPDVWQQNVYWSWLYTLKPLTDSKDGRYPEFMQSPAWADKELNTFLGSWTELKHDTILYAKQVYAELGGGGDDVKKDDRGYVEPNPELFNRLAALAKQTRTGLESRKIINDDLDKDLVLMETMSSRLGKIAQDELDKKALSDDAYEFIRSFGGQLEHFWYTVNKEEIEASKLDQTQYLQQNPAAIVADVATDPNGQVLEEGTGRVSTIYVVFTLEGKRRIAEGSVYSYYEFTKPLAGRLTDEAWRDLLSNGGDDAPKVPDWTESFMISK